tara:strand:- start:1921 stop:2292 length:372 start_codon:yes stop_codon:yes gene_type:complete
MIRRFFAKYWREALIIVMVIGVSVAWSQDHRSLIKAYDSAVISYEAQLEALNESHQRELERKEQALHEYQAKMDEIQKEYLEFRESVEEQKATRVAELTEIRHSNPDALVEEIENAFGFEYVE